MSGVAVLLHAKGYDVSGCDLSSSPRTQWLESLGIPVAIGHSPSHITDDLDELVVTPAVPKSNSEFATATNYSLSTTHSPLSIRYRGEVLASIVNSENAIAVCGTHGKTTTSTFITRLLQELGESPSWCIGGETGSLPVAGYTTNHYHSLTTTRHPLPCAQQRHCEARSDVAISSPLVVEADESDGTLALYKPQTLVLTSADMDHLEHFESEEAYFNCYRTVLKNSHNVIVCRDHAKAFELASESHPSPITYGTHELSDVRATNIKLNADSSSFTVILSERFGGESAEFTIPVSGSHNVLNALAAITVARLHNPTLINVIASEAWQSKLAKACSTLPARRFETLVDANGIKIITDYAHHPAELKRAVEMARLANPKRLRVLFQPHRYSRTKALADEFPAAFENADELILIPVYPAFEEPIPGGDIADLYKKILDHRNNSGHCEARSDVAILNPLILSRSVSEAWRHAYLTAQPGDMILLMGAGDIISIAPRVKEDMKNFTVRREWTSLANHSFFKTGGKTCGGGAPLIIGAGSNTWISDCATDCEITKSRNNEITESQNYEISKLRNIETSLSGSKLISLLNAAGYHFLDFMAGIPGSIGGWTAMNAGAFGHSFGDYVESITFADGTVISHDECGFEYRKCAVAARGLIVSITLSPVSLNPSQPTNELHREHYLAKRNPFPPRTCGSVFKNPPNDFAGRLLEEVGAKSLSVGGAYIWEEHANVIVAKDGCTSSDILALSRLMIAAVREKFGITLEYEIKGFTQF